MFTAPRAMLVIPAIVLGIPISWAAVALLRRYFPYVVIRRPVESSLSQGLLTEQEAEEEQEYPSVDPRGRPCDVPVTRAPAGEESSLLSVHRKGSIHDSVTLGRCGGAITGPGVDIWVDRDGQTESNPCNCTSTHGENDGFAGSGSLLPDAADHRSGDGSFAEEDYGDENRPETSGTILNFVPTRRSDCDGCDNKLGSGFDWTRDYEEIGRLQESSEGPVRVVKRIQSGKLLVVKTVAVPLTVEGYHLPNEVELLSNRLARHLNIVEFCGFHADGLSAKGNPLCSMLIEYCTGGDLFQLIKQHEATDRVVSRLFILHFIVSMADALGYLHHGLGPAGDYSGQDDCAQHQSVLHRDIKPDNIFLRLPGHNPYGLPDIVLGDLGLACLASHCTSVAGTSTYMAPEVRAAAALAAANSAEFDALSGTQVMTRASDVYSFGATLYGLVTLQPYKAGRSDLLALLASGRLAGIMFVAMLLRDCLAEDPRERLSTRDLHAEAADIKRLMAELHEAGERVPALSPSPPAPAASGPAHLSEGRSSPSAYSFDADEMIDVDGSLQAVAGSRDGFCARACSVPGANGAGPGWQIGSGVHGRSIGLMRPKRRASLSPVRPYTTLSMRLAASAPEILFKTPRAALRRRFTNESGQDDED